MSNENEAVGVVDPWRNLNDGFEKVAVDKLKFHPQNPNRGNVSAISQSIESNGWSGVVLVQRGTNHIISGEHRVRAAMESNQETIDVMWVKCSDERALRLLLAHNRARDLAEYDDQVLAEMLEDLALGEGGLGGTLWTEEDAKDLFDRVDVGVGEDIMSQFEDSEGKAVPSTGDQAPSASHVRMFQLFLNGATHPPFIEDVEALKAHLNVDNATDAVLSAVRFAAEEMLKR